jgi:phenylalanyl-tRNA synthetase beta chain
LQKAAPLDVYDAKGLAVQLVTELTGAKVEVRWAGAGGNKLPHLHPRGAAELWVGSTFVGCFGPLHPDVIDELGLGGSVFCVEIDLAALEQLPDKPVARFEPLPKLPAITRDLALETDSSLSAQELLDEIQQSAGELCESVELFDLFVPDSNQPLRRSLAFRIVYRDPKAKSDPDKAKTLTDKEVDSRQERVVEAVRRLGAVLRA